MKRTANIPALTTGLLLGAYSKGFFPMADPEDGRIGWHSPDPRAVILLDDFRVTRSLKRTVERETFTVTTDLDFPAVVARCAERDETWISREIADAYTGLWREGYAHSVECRSGGELAGGLYGVAIGGAFFGESMFSLRTDASKVALVHLVGILRGGGFTLLDIQFITAHLARFGAIEISRETYLGLLARSLPKTVKFPPPGPKPLPPGY
ncbi:MAG TPA: leucyl/phenylalanyl-tRNA--protein transferase [Bacteroidota bacterium]|nr:leucyl/phenylalanyl-tRNA--protein transferase [Bacteroidota bacterium]